VHIDKNELDKNENLATNMPFQYKYFIAQPAGGPNNQPGRMFIKQVEYSYRNIELKEHTTNSFDEEIYINDKWPQADKDGNLCRIDDGWLLSGQHELQFHFYSEPLQLFLPELKSEKPLYFEIIPWRAGAGLQQLDNYTIKSADFDENQIVYDQPRNNVFNALNNTSIYSTFRIRTYEKPNNLVGIIFLLL
jgi:hypothetical protein